MGGPNLHRGEINWIDDIFISYSLALPTNEKNPVTTGYLKKNMGAYPQPQGTFYLSYFTVEARDTSGPKSTLLHRYDTGMLLAQVDWKNQSGSRLHLGMMTGYDFSASQLPAGWKAAQQEGIYSIYISAANSSEPGIGIEASAQPATVRHIGDHGDETGGDHGSEHGGGQGGNTPPTGTVSLHVNRKMAIEGAILTIYLPQGMVTENIGLLLSQHKQPATPVEFTLSRDGTWIEVGCCSGTLQTGQYVIAYREPQS